MITFSGTHSLYAARLSSQQQTPRFGAQLVNPGKVVVDRDDPPRNIQSATAVATRYILPLIKGLEPDLTRLVAGDDLPGVIKPYPVLVRTSGGENMIGLGIQHDVPGKDPVCTETYPDQRIRAEEAAMETPADILKSFQQLVQRRRVFLATGRDPAHRAELGDL